MLPSALFIGIPYETFWKLNPATLAAYQEAFDKKAKLEAKERDTVAWLQGAYVMRAVAAAVNSKNQYPKAPLAQEEARTQAQKADGFRAYAERFNRRHGYEVKLSGSTTKSINDE